MMLYMVLIPQNVILIPDFYDVLWQQLSFINSKNDEEYEDYQTRYYTAMSSKEIKPTHST